MRQWAKEVHLCELDRECNEILCIDYWVKMKQMILFEYFRFHKFENRKDWDKDSKARCLVEQAIDKEIDTRSPFYIFDTATSELEDPCSNHRVISAAKNCKHGKSSFHNDLSQSFIISELPFPPPRGSLNPKILSLLLIKS